MERPEWNPRLEWLFVKQSWQTVLQTVKQSQGTGKFRMNSHISQYFLASETRTRPKSFCKIKRKDGHFGWGCLVDDAPDETSDWTKYFILTSSKAIPKENFDAKEYEVEFTKRRGKCCRLTDIAKTVHHILSGLVLIAIYPQSYEFNHAMFQTAPCFRRHKSCSVLEKSPRVDVARSESSSHFFFIDKELYDFQPNGNTSLKDGYKGCCSVLFELSNEDLKVQAVGIVNLEDNGQSSPILLPKSSLNTILDDENQTVEEEQRRQEEEERNSKKEVERRKVEEVKMKQGEKEKNWKKEEERQRKEEEESKIKENEKRKRKEEEEKRRKEEEESAKKEKEERKRKEEEESKIKKEEERKRRKEEKKRRKEEEESAKKEEEERKRKEEEEKERKRKEEEESKIKKEEERKRKEEEEKRGKEEEESTKKEEEERKGKEEEESKIRKEEERKRRKEEEKRRKEEEESAKKEEEERKRKEEEESKIKKEEERKRREEEEKRRKEEEESAKKEEEERKRKEEEESKIKNEQERKRKEEEEKRRKEEEERMTKVEEEKNREQGTGTVTEEHITRVKVIPPCLSDAQREEFVKFFLLDVSLFAKNNRTSLDTGLHALIEHIQDVYNVCVGKLGIGCLEITVQCPTLDSLERLWSDTRSGCIDKFAEKFLVTSTFKTKLGVENMTLKVEIKEEDYKACRESFNPHLGNSVKVDSFIATVTSPFASTKEMTNYARLCRLLVNVGFQVLRSTFDNIHPPATLRTVLGSTSVHYATLQSLYVKGKEKVLNPMQWRKLYPTHSPVSSVTFDITLLTVLLRNICGLSPPATGWDRLPPAADICIADDIARVKYYRNSVYGHASQASIDDKSFNVYWQEIREALVRLGGARFRADIDKLKQDCMDPDMEKHYCKLMEKWKKDDDNIKEKLEEIEDTTKGSVEKIKGEMAKMDSEVAEVQKLSTLTLPAGESKDEGGIEDTVKETIKECSDRGGTSVSESNKELNQLHSAERDIYVTRKKSLLPYGFSVDSRDATGRTPLMKEAWNGDVQAVKGLIERGANPSLMDNRRWNSLHFAACGGDLDIISLIHSRVKDIESKEVEGYTPLMIAAFNGKLQAVKWFLEEGAAKTCVCNRGWNLLHCAALSGDPDVMGVILPHVPDIECKNANGQTPLIIAVRKGNLQSVKLLLERGANPFAKDNNGQDSLYYASSDDSNMFDFLLSHVGKSELTTGND
ncbi:Reticulocyte-binding protein 2-like a [Stylophora pistillata]|uniref:Reticulocyte-binding protein 2-like a n=1 Tax=Stylophora pistillata TaxID=50429 RepID=A0A2B4RDR2_STYPI|nr:Reticulocyte-binding protein 2-like a [Stylophora pistillata]